MGVLLSAALISQSLIWLAPAPILRPIIEDLRISLGSAGLIISIIALCIAIFSFLGAMVAQRLGALRAMTLGVWLLGASAVASGYTASFATLLACRVGEGVGFGLMISPPGTLVMQWFAEREWAYVNMALALCSYIGLTAVFRVTVPIYEAVGQSWRAVLRDYGVAVVLIAILWTMLGREHAPEAPGQPVASGQTSALREAMKMRGVRMIALALFGGMWVFQLYTAFLPSYFQALRGMSLSEASSLTAILPLTGMLAAAGGGFGTGFTGLRKPFTWPIGLMTLFGCAGCVMLPGVGAIRVSLILLGIGSAGSLAAITTMLMELPDMTPARTGAALALVWAVGYAGAFVSPFLGGAVAGAIGLRAVMLLFLSLQLLPVTLFYILPETGRGRGRVGVATAASA
jgi:predicted MFS family arabinose efflux permease